VVHSFDTKARVATEGEKFDAINAVITGLGTVTGAGTIGADQKLDFQMTAQLSKSGGVVGTLIQTAGIGQLSNVPFRISGTTADPKFQPDVGAIFKSSTSNSQAPAGAAQPQNQLNQVLNLFKKKK
jgi:hypothetical protein